VGYDGTKKGAPPKRVFKRWSHGREGTKNINLTTVVPQQDDGLTEFQNTESLKATYILGGEKVPVTAYTPEAQPKRNRGKPQEEEPTVPNGFTGWKQS